MRHVRHLGKLQRGFTLIELIIVIVLVGILAAVAVPQYTNLQTQASLAATQGIAGALASANSTNYAVRSGFPTLGSAVANCTDNSALLSGGLPAGYTITPLAIANGVTATCTVTGPNAQTATFIGHGIT